MERFGAQLEEDHVYYIRYFQVLDAKQSYRAVKHPYMARFTPHTKIQEFFNVPSNFPLHAYEPISFDMMRTRIGNDELLTDAVGLLVECGHASDKNTSKGVTRLRNIRISNGTETISVALWGKHADAFDVSQFMGGDHESPVVLLLCAMMCRVFNDSLSIQTSSLTRWYINPDIPEADVLKKSSIEVACAPTWSQPARPPRAAETVTCAELASITNPHPEMEKQFIVTAKIKAVVPQLSWWYLACNTCSKKMEPDGENYKCSGKTCKSVSGSPKYRLAVRAVDAEVALSDNLAASIELVFFGRTAEELIGIPVQDLIATGDGVDAFLPSKITSLYGKTYEIRISVTRWSLRTTNIAFQVDSILRLIEDTAGSSAPVELTVATAGGEEPGTSTIMRSEPSTAGEASPEADTVVPIQEHEATLKTQAENAANTRPPAPTPSAEMVASTTRHAAKRPADTKDEARGEQERRYVPYDRRYTTMQIKTSYTFVSCLMSGRLLSN